METARRVVLAGFVSLGLALTAVAQEPSAGPAQSPCSSPEHREFDFWIGEWNVTEPDGSVAGTNRIESILDGCVLQESWKSTDGRSQGRSFNIRGRDGLWHQTWVDNQGLLLELEGGIDAEGRMVMRQELARPRDGKKVLHEIAWTPLEARKVRLHLSMSEDGGVSWQDVFVGLYTKKE